MHRCRKPHKHLSGHERFLNDIFQFLENLTDEERAHGRAEFKRRWPEADAYMKKQMINNEPIDKDKLAGMMDLENEENFFLFILHLGDLILYWT